MTSELIMTENIIHMSSENIVQNLIFNMSLQKQAFLNIMVWYKELIVPFLTKSCACYLINRCLSISLDFDIPERV